MFAYLILTFLAQSIAQGDTLEVSSPSKNITVRTWISGGVPHYAVDAYDGQVIRPSKMGFTLRGAPRLGGAFRIVAHEMSSFDEIWEQVWGEKRFIRDRHNELRLRLEETREPKRRLDIVFRVFDDGVGFRYEFPDQEHLHYFEIMDEATEFAMTGNHTAWWIPAYKDNRYEYLYTESPISAMDKVHTPLTMETRDGLYVSIHEAALTDFASMVIANTGSHVLKADLVPWVDGVRVKVFAPHVSPWRTIQIARRPGDLITSYLILNLNEPNRIEDTSWITPGKYVGIWWGMHINLWTFWQGPRHGATTERAIRYLDFAADNGFLGALVEGWNVGWGGSSEGGFRYTEAVPDFDIDSVAAHAARRGVRIIGHHETNGGVANYEAQIEDAFSFYKGLGINTIKTGYVGRRVDSGEWHHGQSMVRHYRNVVELAAETGIMLDVHEPIKDTGIRRTWPNMMTREGARGQEYNAFGENRGNPPDHDTILPFTRMLAGPFDFTPGIFDHDFRETRPDNLVQTTIAKQLAYYVVLYSPLHMAADLPENYEGQPAFQFIKDVPTDWDDTVVPAASIGDYVVIARKDRNSDDWYLGAVTDEEARTLEMPLTFLDRGKRYTAEIYADGESADYETNQTDVVIRSAEVTAGSTLFLRLARGGGQAIRFSPKSWVRGPNRET
ncbi:MAG TPA: glycoside hydrolase family 97 protein [Rhodothermia bacterium]|nr:glycoside hydrolase family 97 protein [Rhodothermia bacterium]